MNENDLDMEFYEEKESFQFELKNIPNYLSYELYQIILITVTLFFGFCAASLTFFQV